MAIEQTTREDQYGVARGTDLLDVYPTIQDATRQLAHIEAMMKRIGLNPDVSLVQVTKTTTYSKPKPYVPPVASHGDATTPQGQETDETSDTESK